MEEPADDLRALYRARPAGVTYLDVPELNYLVLAGAGAPEGAAFQEATEALYAISSTAHFVARRRTGSAPKLMPLEALWWRDNAAPVELVAAVALGVADVRRSDRRNWRWQAMIVQPPGIDDAVFEQAVLLARKRDLPRVDEVRLVRWREGRVAQLSHVGSYSSAARAVTELHDAIEAAGLRPTGRHHEIYLRDPRRTGRDAMRMVLRRPVEVQ